MNRVADIWAKSSRDKKTPGETLDHHSRQLIYKFWQLYQRNSRLADKDWLNEPRLWQRVFWSCFLHDFGKVAVGFQKQLRDSTIWGQRHEVLSLAFLPWVLPEDGPDYTWVAAAIASHHRDAGLKSDGSQNEGRYYIFSAYNINNTRILEKSLKDMLEGIKQEDLEALAWIIKDGVPTLFKQHPLSQLGIEPAVALPPNIDLAAFLNNAPDIIYDALCRYRELITDVLEPELKAKTDLRQHLLNRQAIALRGMLLLSDRLASSYADRIELMDLPEQPLLFKRRNFLPPNDKPRLHQQKAAHVDGTLLLSAPTGSGKTEAALMWARRQQENDKQQPILVYLLPFQASMNAMRDRLAQSLFEPLPRSSSDTSGKVSYDLEKVALMHGRSSQVLYKQMSNPGTDPKNIEKNVKRARAMAPFVPIFLPFGLLGKLPIHHSHYAFLLANSFSLRLLDLS